MDECVFCDIVAGSSPASVVHQDDAAIAFMTVEPVNPGHVLVIPKAHVPYMKDMDEETGAHLFRVAMRVEKAIRDSGLRCEGINLFLADGEAAGQEIFHLHIHVFPRFKGDRFKLGPGLSKPAWGELDEAAAILRAHYP